VGVSGFFSVKEQCCRANRRLNATGLVDLTFGNVSVFEPAAGVFAIKPSGVPYDELLPEHMVVVDLAGKVVEGTLRPSSDTPTHAQILGAWSGVHSVVHTHSRYAVSFAQAGREIPCLGTTHADYFHGPVPLTRPLSSAEIGNGYELNTGKVIVERFSELDPLEIPAVLVWQHGPFAWGPSSSQALENAQALEIVAEMAFRTLALDPAAGVLAARLLEKHFFRKHGRERYYGQPTEK
jgi:L-ribulose-5-phosphate 4-epimerase